MSTYHAKKRLGQNFLKTDSVVERVVALVEPSADDNIVEIGAGRGALTRLLAESGARVWTVEFDRDLIGYLTSLLSSFDRVQVLNQDFLKFDPKQTGIDRLKLIGNLPYNITSPVIDWCLQYRDRIETAVIMVQKEVGARLTATPGSKDWSPLSIFTQLAYRVELCFEVAPEHFRPPPQVTSSVLRLFPLLEPEAELTPALQRVVRAAFKQRRKTLLNNLVRELASSPDEVRAILDELSLDDRIRAEALTIEQFLNLTSLLNNRKLV